jgi:hypothetical protein
MERGLLHEHERFANPGLMRLNENMSSAEYGVSGVTSSNLKRSIKANHRWVMKEYKLLSWPDLPAEFRRTGFRRLLSELSQRHMSEAMLMKRDGLKPADVRALLAYLDQLGLLETRQAAPAAGWRPALTGWLRRLTA